MSSASPHVEDGARLKTRPPVSAPGAVILAGGYGTRMHPLSLHRPKHLLPLGNDSVIGHQLRRLAFAGIQDVVLATAHHADAFGPALGDGAAYGVNLHIAHEHSPQGTGGALRTALEVLPRQCQSVLVLNGDLVSAHDLQAQVTAHAASGAFATVHGRWVENSAPYGLLHTRGVRITAFEEKPVLGPAGLVNAGTYIFNRAVERYLPEGESSLERDLFPALIAAGENVCYWRDDAPFADIGSPSALLDANMAWAREHTDGTSVILGSTDSADIQESLIMAGATVERGARIYRSIVAPGARIGAWAQVSDCVIADGVTVPAGSDVQGQTLTTTP